MCPMSRTRGALLGIVASAILAGCVGGGAPTSTAVRQQVRGHEVAHLPNGTPVAVDGLVVIEEGRTRLAYVLIDIPPAGYSQALDLLGADVEQFDGFRLPRTDVLWSDFYRVSGTVLDGAINVEELELLKANTDRKQMEDCEAALDGPDDLGTCPESWYIELYTERFGEPPPG